MLIKSLLPPLYPKCHSREIRCHVLRNFWEARYLNRAHSQLHPSQSAGIYPSERRTGHIGLLTCFILPSLLPPGLSGVLCSPLPRLGWAPPLRWVWSGRLLVRQQTQATWLVGIRYISGCIALKVPGQERLLCNRLSTQNLSPPFIWKAGSPFVVSHCISFQLQLPIIPHL